MLTLKKENRTKINIHGLHLERGSLEDQSARNGGLYYNKIEGGVYDWNEQHHRTGNEIKRWRYIVTALYTEMHKQE